MTSTPAPTFDAVVTQVMGRIRDGAYGDAHALLAEHGARFPEQAPMVLYLRSCAAARLGRTEQAVRELRDAADQGFWYSERILRDTPSFQPLQGMPAFEAQVAEFSARHAAAPRQPRRFVAQPPATATTDRPPLLVALHGNGDNATNALAAWRPLTEDGWLLAALQSSAIEMVDGHVWDDQDLAKREIQEHYRALRQEHRLDDEDRGIIAGFSMGGETALRLALDGTAPVRGFILLAPSGPPDIDDWLPLIRRAPRLRGYVLRGADDHSISQEPTSALVDRLNDNGIPCGFELLPGVGHEYPPDLAAPARRALAFIDS